MIPSQTSRTRLNELIEESHQIVTDAIKSEVTDANRSLAGLVVLYSGGKDSTTMAHLFKDRADYAAHANTGIGIEETRQFVRDTCAYWNLPLIEKHPPAGSTYRELVLDQGFPGPAHHYKMYQRLKERCIEQVRNQLVEHPYRQRVVFLAGRRASESKRRAQLANQSPVQRKGSMVWVSPMVNWTKADLDLYRATEYDLPINEVSETLDMSGECLCGSFAKPDEISKIDRWYPEAAAEIHALEREVTAAGVICPERCTWGWGANKRNASKVGLMCTGCEMRYQAS